MADLPSGLTRRRIRNFFAVEEGFKQRQLLQLLALTALNVAGATGALLALQHYEYAAHWDGSYDTSGLALLRTAVACAALMGGLGGALVLYMGVLNTHRIAGPIHRFKQELRRIAAGEPPRPIELRRRDELKDLAEAINAAIDTLWARSSSPPAELEFDLERVRSTHREILDGLEAVDLGALADHDRARVEAWLEQMRALRDKLGSGTASP